MHSRILRQLCWAVAVCSMLRERKAPRQIPRNRVRYRRCWQKVPPAKSLSMLSIFVRSGGLGMCQSRCLDATHTLIDRNIVPLRNTGACLLHLKPVCHCYHKPTSSHASPQIPTFSFCINSTVAELQQQWPRHILDFQPLQTFYFRVLLIKTCVGPYLS
jgi:hypothetical protein